jgi:autotransporter-associated beta strand protein
MHHRPGHAEIMKGASRRPGSAHALGGHVPPLLGSLVLKASHRIRRKPIRTRNIRSTRTVAPFSTTRIQSKTMKPTNTLLVSLLGFCFSQIPSRADQNWDGDNAVGDFNNDNNWYADSQPPWGFANGNFIFNLRNSSSQTSLYYNYGSWKDTNDISWETTFGAALTWNGDSNGINFNQRLENRSSFTQTVGTMKLSGAKNGAAQIELNPVNGDLVMNGAVFNDNSKPYHVYGNNNKTLTLNTTLGVGGTASNVSFTIDQNSTVVMNSAQNYTGTTSVNAGKLFINGDNSGATGAVTAASGTTLGGYGTVGGATTISGTHDVSDSGSDRTQNFSSSLTYVSGSLFNWDLNVISGASNTDPNQGGYDKVIASGAVTGNSAFKIVLGAGTSFTDAFWNTDKSWSDIFAKGSGSDLLASIFTNSNFSGPGVTSNGFVSGEGQFSFSGDTLNWTAVPEPSNLLAGVLLMAGILRRRR